MNKDIQKIKNLRRFLLTQTEGLTTEQLNIIPAGFNNNIIWNLAHLAAVQQSLCYLRSGLPATIEEKMVTPYLPGTRPVGLVEEADISIIRQQLLTSIDKLQADYADNRFTSYSPSERILQVYGVEVNNIDDALAFMRYHEGFHIGCVFMLKHLV